VEDGCAPLTPIENWFVIFYVIELKQFFTSIIIHRREEVMGLKKLMICLKIISVLGRVFQKLIFCVSKSPNADASELY